MREELIDAVMDACKSESGVTFEFSKNAEDSPHLFWPTLLSVPPTDRLYHGNLEFHLFDFFDNAEKNDGKLVVEHVVIDDGCVVVEGNFENEDFWFNVLFHPPEHAEPRGVALSGGRILFDDGREGHCDDDEEDDEEDVESDDVEVDPDLVCNEPYAQILKDPPLALRCAKRKGHKGDHGQVV